ncbi:immune-induced peptide 18 [Drosophila madeirensis]|uniref:Immune-induced peptide 18 n=1 Tax=Drosophila madeirensis TaxID=30013 RepID=A0AAU9GDZ8_DROMD|nr:immune-induced peptide 18 [Drosophila guanche]XP_034655057.1 immune-induced peptide 18 [Drosophila subobscura]
MKLFALCCLLFALLGCLISPSQGSPSRGSPSPGGAGGNPFRSPPAPRPFIYDSPVRRPSQPKTMYA